MYPDLVAPLLDPTDLPRIVTLCEALALGWSPSAIRHQLRTGRWRRVLPRTYLTDRTLLWSDRLAAALAFAGDGALLSSAAALCDLGLTSVSRPSSVLVLVPAGRQPRSVDWVRVRPSARPVRRAVLSGPARASVARAVADLALERRRLDDVRALVAETVRKRLCTIDELSLELRHVPRRGSAFFRQAVDEVGGGAWSAPEARAATLLRRAGAPEFGQNRTVELPDGRSFVVDFLWKDLRAILEIDSDTHHALTGDADWTADRHEALETAGFSVIHRTPRFVIREPERFVSGVLTWLASRPR